MGRPLLGGLTAGIREVMKKASTEVGAFFLPWVWWGCSPNRPVGLAGFDGGGGLTDLPPV